MEISHGRLSGVLKKDDTGIVFDARELCFQIPFVLMKSRRIFIKSRRKLTKSRRVLKQVIFQGMLKTLLIKYVVEHHYILLTYLCNGYQIVYK